MNRNRHHPLESGFSTIELLVGLVILGIVMTFAVPGVREFTTTMRIRGARETLLSDLRFSRSRAAAENNNYYVTWNTGTNTYSIVDDNDNNGSVDAGELIGTKTVDTRVSVTNGPGTPFPTNRVTFFPNGTASASGEVTFTCSVGSGPTMGLAVLGPTGIVSPK